MPKDIPGVMSEFKSGQLHSGSKTGKVVTNRKQAVAIALSEQRKQGKNISPPQTTPNIAPTPPMPAPPVPRAPRGEFVPGLMATRNNLRNIRQQSIKHIKRGSR